MAEQLKAVHISSAHPRYDSRIFTREAAGLAAAGFKVSLVIADDKPNEVKDGVEIISVGPKAPGRLKRMFKTSKAVAKKAAAIDADIYHFHDPELLPQALKMAKSGKCCIFDMHEDMPLQILGKHWIPRFLRKPVAKLYARYEAKALARLAGVISVTPHIVERLAGYNPNALCLANFPPLSYLEREADIAGIREKIVAAAPVDAAEIDKAFKVCFAGGIKSDYRHECVLAALKKAAARAERRIIYILAGNFEADYREKIEPYIKEGFAVYIGRISPEEVQDLIAYSDAGAALHYSSQLAGKGSLGVLKIFEYMAAGLPFVCSDYPIWQTAVQVEGFEQPAGICVSAFDCDAVCEAFLSIMQNEKTALMMGRAGRSAVRQKFNREAELADLCDFYRKTLSQRKSGI